MNQHRPCTGSTRFTTDVPLEDPDFEWLIESEPWGLRQAARLMYYLGWTLLLDPAQVSSAEQERIQQIVNVFRSTRPIFHGGRSRVGLLRGVG